jgi:hypothetical protein
MSVIERGAARCPRCMALADYRFLEKDDGRLRYEVSCRPCGNVYSEDCAPADVPAA